MVYFSGAVTDDEELNNGIVNEAVKQRLAEQMRTKTNPFNKKPQLLDPTNPASLPELQVRKYSQFSLF